MFTRREIFKLLPCVSAVAATSTEYPTLDGSPQLFVGVDVREVSRDE
jgi:hypothetical protein